MVKSSLCEYCGRTISLSNMSKHIRSHQKGNVKNHYSLDHDDLCCKFCHNEYKNKNSLVQHEIRCALNPHKLHSNTPNEFLYTKGHSPWNKGLTKHTDERVRQYGLKASKTLTGKSIGRASTQEGEMLRRQKIRRSMRNNPFSGGLRHGSGRGRKGWYKGFFCDSTYELVFVIYNLDHGAPFKRNTDFYEYTYNGRKHKYYPDFEMNDGSLIEVKGYKTDVTDIKLKSVTDKPIKILYKNDMLHMFEYVRTHYTYNHLYDLYDS